MVTETSESLARAGWTHSKPNKINIQQTLLKKQELKEN
jgi:hypothetical protein